MGSQDLDSPSRSDTASPDILDLQDDEGWDDVERDEEEESLNIQCLFDDVTLADVTSLTRHTKEAHDWDLNKIISDLDLDFYGAIKFVNYVRSEVKSGKTPRIDSKSVFEDEKYLKPVLEDDALLFSIDDLLTESGSVRSNKVNLATTNDRVRELEEELQDVKSQFKEYQRVVQKTLNDRLDATVSSVASTSESNAKVTATKVEDAEAETQDDDSHYFKSYAYNDIHEVMLKDTVRTDAYRDFIYEHKNLFAGKVVLDVGCGTGILSMFCAKAGAKRVIAVDNSDIINKARENVFENGLDKVITCLRGKIEEVSMPVAKVDIIVSEWMGYCLLYEAMLDSVLWARDEYLAPDGLMIPSHTTLCLAPLTDPDYITSHINFWRSVYGFSMTSMLEGIYEDVLIQTVPAQHLASPPVTFLRLPLHTIQSRELSFVSDFEMTLEKDIDELDGWVIWFDTFFVPSRNDSVAQTARAEDWAAGKLDGVAFTTGPAGKETHWRQGVLLVDHGKAEIQPLKAGEKIRGQIEYRKRKENLRELEIEMSWSAREGKETGKQLWFMR
ncbi:MAG: hypothetical protein M1825_002506 [Sarcosagium campestre]|nr:MAG: hypothetical protein M1825_002506 [Sarcosagium campestre]